MIRYDKKKIKLLLKDVKYCQREKERERERELFIIIKFSELN